VGAGKKTARKRAVGTREHIIAYLTEVNELFDANGMASTQLAAAVGYPGSSVAFAQLLSGMERSGLIEREVRGKRTYRISLGRARAAGAVRMAAEGVRATSGVPGISAVAGSAGIAAAGGVGPGMGGFGPGFGPGAGGFDYDELARRLLVQVVRRLAAADAGAEPPDRSAPVDQLRSEGQLISAGQPGSGGQRGSAGQPGSGGQPGSAGQPGGRGQQDQSALQETVTGLEYELATAWSKHGKLAEENVRLREQLRAAQRSLAQAAEQVRRLPVRTGLDSSEVLLLQRLLAAGGADSPDTPGGPDDAGAEVPGLLARSGRSEAAD
jgi:hypothetical protein